LIQINVIVKFLCQSVRFRQDGWTGLWPWLKGSDMGRDSRGKIAVIDDDAAVRDSLRLLLEIVGYPVETFESAAEFLGADLQHLPCLIADYHMPYMTGLELAERLRADGPNIPILLMTGSPTSALLARAAEVGFDRVLEKPTSDKDLLDFINATQS
jgi:two-component system, LuxR family, response regulator FixJ